MTPDEFESKIPVYKISAQKQLNRQVPPAAHTPMYIWHKYWSRKTWNVIAEFVKTYCPENGIVFDPFAGSGIVAMEALKNKRRAIVADISPIATEITRLTIKPVSVEKLHEVYKTVEGKVKDKILDLYKTKCRKCGNEFPLTCAIWKQKRQSSDKPISRECIDIRYKACPKCGDRKEKDNPPNSFDFEKLKQIDEMEIKEWYPKNRLYHINGKPFMKKEKYESVDELFTKRNLQALAWLMEAIEEETNRDLRDFLKIAFTSMVHLCTTMCPISEGGHFTPYSSAWTQQSYWFPSGPFMEQNVWLKFEGSMIGNQGLLNGKNESNKYFKDVKFAQSFEEVVNGEADIFIYTGSSFDLIKQMRNVSGNSGCADYIFTDPPYDSSIQYGELAYMWISWLKKDEGYLEKIATDEVIHNKQQEKSFDTYHSLLSRSFEEMYSVLKPDAYLTVTFHNPTFKVRNATIRAGVIAGFELQKIHHQELARASAKSLLQPFGSAQGDFYLRFFKPPQDEKSIEPEAIDEARFEKIVIDTATQIIAERGEPTPYTILINAIDPELAKRGFFSELKTGLNINTVLESRLNNEFTLVKAKLGGAEGDLWWFSNPSNISHLEKIPLSERVEQTVLRFLQKQGRSTFTEVWDAVSREFPNSLTSDQMSIKDALKAYAKPISGGNWLIKPNSKQGEIERDHTIIIATLAKIGKSQGYDIWIGKVEQSHIIPESMNGGKKLGELVTYKNIRSLTNIQNPDTVEDIDLLWIKDDQIVCAFEIESTTSMTSGLQRGSNIDSSVPKFLVMPEERESQLFQKMKSPMFIERFQNDSWKVIYFGALTEEYMKSKGKTNIFKLENKKVVDKMSQKTSKNQLDLFNNKLKS
ncbi:hypothetical protein A2803_05655 [Candidatus Woesebacteria bacterium RIFCSPHIGHO2_01_FULL_44_21]|uniref:DNA methylase N-4/N-6 domain-containing protein n=1 Tax=Candidatus Woesebacteria bacterium RIFCSPHIGHO2_01_FULL_44_21 TaxID=1802503 RepID=A0A1F7Z246_9BACT|nr:MAG: hypothetical protein A2803_05655 [Candidatus Woesebacteria bacterium RIFCSPHIGHO2_01_FULL_44_21]OGM71120.1 MAG: hypothetical protein A2897_02770 [Candidatus Woesebacteria bacterium RIFCSPLOWO2_01_FULL_44_24b]